MSQFTKFYFTSSMLNMFRTLMHQSSGACDFFLLYHHIGCVLLFRCVLEFRFGWLEWYPCSRFQPAGVVSGLQATACSPDTTPA